jgi:hypothetical protein
MNSLVITHKFIRVIRNHKARTFYREFHELNLKNPPTNYQAFLLVRIPRLAYCHLVLNGAKLFQSNLKYLVMTSLDNIPMTDRHRHIGRNALVIQQRSQRTALVTHVHAALCKKDRCVKARYAFLLQTDVTSRAPANRQPAVR